MKQYEFILPISNKKGMMRLASAYDEMHVMRDERTQKDPENAKKILIEMTTVDYEDGSLTLDKIDALEADDYKYLCDFYKKINTRTYKSMDD